MKLVSIIIPAYNSEAFLHKAIRSCKDQTYKNIEIIIVDDGSTDKTLSIAREYEATDNRIVVLSQENSGQAAARNAGLEAATGEFIQFLDSDDYLEKNAIEICINAIGGEGDFSFVLYGFKVYSGEKLLRTPNPGNTLYKSGDGFDAFIHIDRLMASPCNKLFRTSYIKHRFDPNRHYAEDSVFNYSNFTENTNIKTIEDCLYNVMLSTEGSVNKRYRTGQLMDGLISCEVRINALRKVFGQSFTNYPNKDISFVGKLVYLAAINLSYEDFVEEMENAFSHKLFYSVLHQRKGGKEFYKILLKMISKKRFKLARIYCKTARTTIQVVKRIRGLK